GDRLGEEVDNSNQEKREGDQAEPDGNLHPAKFEVQGNLELPLAGPGVAQYEYGQAVHGEAPNNAEGVEVCQEGDIAAADEDGENLQADDDVDDAIAGPEFGVGLAERFGQDAVL